MLRRCVAVLTALVSAGECLAAAQTIVTYEDVLRLAREQSPAITAARARVAETEGALVDTRSRFGGNPVVDAQAGPRRTAGGTALDLSVGVAQELDVAGQQAARRAIARAAVERQTAHVDTVSREVLHEAADLFLRAVAARERLAIADAADRTSRALLESSERRFTLGDISGIDLNLARLDAARSAASLGAARADASDLAGALATLLRLTGAPDLQVSGSLEPSAVRPMVELETAVAVRPDLTVLSIEIREAEAEIDLGRRQARTGVGVRAGYEREDGDHIVTGGLSLTLPFFQKGESTRAVGTARAARLRGELQAARDVALAEVRTARRVAEERASAVTAGAAMLPALTDNDALTQRSYDAGEMNLADLLRLRRDALEARDALIALRLAAALARLHVDYVAGVLR